ncbi:MAG: hypothetical protein WBX09_18255 [Terracidiphilus sp.]
MTGSPGAAADWNSFEKCGGPPEAGQGDKATPVAEIATRPTKISGTANRYANQAQLVEELAANGTAERMHTYGIQRIIENQVLKGVMDAELPRIRRGATPTVTLPQITGQASNQIETRSRSVSGITVEMASIAPQR